MADDPWAEFTPVAPAPQQQAPAAPAAAPAADPWAEFTPVDAAPTSAPPLTVTPAPQPPQQAPAPQQGGWWDTIKDQASQAGQAADDIVRLTANGMTLGYADKLAAWANGDSVADERAKSQAASDRAQWAGTVAGLGGALAPSGLVGDGVAALGAAGEALPYVGKLLTNPWAQSAATGAAIGVGQAAGNDQDIGTGALLGAGVGLAGQGVAAGLDRAAGLFNLKPLIPSAADLKTAAQSAYQAADNAGVIVSPQAVQQLGGGIRQTMTDFGYHPTMQPGGPAVLSTLGDMEQNGATLKGLDTLRQIAGRMREQGGSSAALGSRIVGQIDGFANGLQPADVVAGNAQAGVDALTNARTLWQRASKTDALDNAVSKAELRASSTGSGGNADNATRQNVRRLYEQGGSYTPDERQAMLNVIQGTPMQNTLRAVGKLSPEHGGLMSALHVGAAVERPELLLGSMAAGVAKHTADWMTKSNVQKLADLLASGGDAAAIAPQTGPLQQLAQAKRQALANMLAGGLITQAIPAGAQ